VAYASFFSLGAGAVLGWIAFSTFWLFPDPQAADRNGLLRWLALRDLSRYSRELQVALVNRLQDSVSPTDLVSSAKSDHGNWDRYGPRIRQNAQVLKKVWFETRCGEYTHCDPAQRVPFLERQVDALLSWSGVLERTDQAGGSAKSGAGSSYAWTFLAELETWLDEAQPALRTNMEAAVRDAIICWLATSDLEKHSMDSRRAIARRLAQELQEGKAADGPQLELSSELQATLRGNALLLMEGWLHEQAQTYSALPGNERTAFVDKCLANVKTWNIERYLTGPAGDASGVSAALSEVPKWLERAAPEQRKQLGDFTSHAQQRILLHAFQKLMPLRTSTVES
jgi:hypothetical protein